MMKNNFTLQGIAYREKLVQCLQNYIYVYIFIYILFIFFKSYTYDLKTKHINDICKRLKRFIYYITFVL